MSAGHRRLAAATGRRDAVAQIVSLRATREKASGELRRSGAWAGRSGQIVSISAHCVRAGDEFEWEYGLEEKLKHKPAGGVRGDITHAYAVAELVGGGHAYEVMTRAQVDRVMLRSQSGGKWGPWRDRYESMARKSAIRMLVKHLPMTVELATATDAD